MISANDLQALQRYAPTEESRVLSVYLDVDQSKAPNLNRGFETCLKNLLKSVGERLRDAAERNQFEANRQRVESFVHRLEPEGRSIVLFSDVGRDFWWTRQLPISIPSVARFSAAPYVRTLIETMDEHERYGVVLVDQQRARLFSVHLGEIEEVQEMFSDVPGKVDTSTRDAIRSQMKIQRHHDQHVTWHLKEVADRLARLSQRYQFDRLIVGGPDKAVTEFLSVLPKRLRHRVVDTISLTINADERTVLAETRKVEERVNREDELRSVETLITAAHKGDRATTGLSETLRAVSEGRVWRLLYSNGFSPDGYECRECGALFSQPRPQCPLCKGELKREPNLLNRVIDRVLDQEGRVEGVHGHAAERLAQADHIGALLRF
jgi:peptide subunit release factor 1 (eRF1)